MSEYRRLYATGGQYFFTVVTAERRPILTNSDVLQFFRQAIIDTRRTMPFTITAMVVLPDHFHAIWTLPKGDHDFSSRMKLIKALVKKSRWRLEARRSVNRFREWFAANAVFGKGDSGSI